MKDFRAEGTINKETYRLYYRHASGGVFRSVGHMRSHMEAEKAFQKLPKKEVK